MDTIKSVKKHIFISEKKFEHCEIATVFTIAINDW